MAPVAARLRMIMATIALVRVMIAVSSLFCFRSDIFIDDFSNLLKSPMYTSEHIRTPLVCAFLITLGNRPEYDPPSRPSPSGTRSSYKISNDARVDNHCYFYFLVPRLGPANQLKAPRTILSKAEFLYLSKLP